MPHAHCETHLNKSNTLFNLIWLNWQKCLNIRKVSQVEWQRNFSSRINKFRSHSLHQLTIGQLSITMVYNDEWHKLKRRGEQEDTMGKYLSEVCPDLEINIELPNKNTKPCNKQPVFFRIKQVVKNKIIHSKHSKLVHIDISSSYDSSDCVLQKYSST